MRPKLIADDALLDAALQAFADLGFEGASVRAVAREIGVSHNTINERFGSKDKLWQAANKRIPCPDCVRRLSDSSRMPPRNRP
jgi:AcrR family transcriptional regulator